MLENYQEKILELLVEMELEMAGLYSFFARKFPKYNELWLSMSKQELNHADQVKKLWIMAKENKIVFNENLTKSYTVSRVIDSVKNAYKQADSGQFKEINALAYSRDFEQSIIEKEFYNYFTTKDPAARMIINGIKNETLMHQSKLKDAWENEKKSSAAH